jgi:hypothetical protein
VGVVDAIMVKRNRDSNKGEMGRRGLVVLEDEGEMAGGGGAQLQLQRRLLLLLLRLRLRLQGLARMPWLPLSPMLRSPLEVLMSLGAVKKLSGEICLLILVCAGGLLPSSCYQMFCR